VRVPSQAAGLVALVWRTGCTCRDKGPSTTQPPESCTHARARKRAPRSPWRVPLLPTGRWSGDGEQRTRGSSQRLGLDQRTAFRRMDTVRMEKSAAANRPPKPEAMARQRRGCQRPSQVQRRCHLHHDPWSSGRCEARQQCRARQHQQRLLRGERRRSDQGVVDEQISPSQSGYFRLRVVPPLQGSWVPKLVPTALGNADSRSKFFVVIWCEQTCSSVKIKSFSSLVNGPLSVF
jgi:hypothetical protein